MSSFLKTCAYASALTFFMWMGDVQQVIACAVCFGDPESDMAKGAVAGIMVLAGFIGFVLIGVAGTGVYWVHRSRRLNHNQELLP